MAEHQPTSDPPAECWATGICGKPLGAPIQKGDYWESRCGTKGHICFFWNGAWHHSQRPVQEAIRKLLAAGAKVVGSVDRAPDIDASTGTASAAIAPKIDGSAQAGSDDRAAEIDTNTGPASDAIAPKINASAGPASDAIAASEVGEDADDLFDEGSLADDLMDELLTDLQGEGPLPTGPTFGNLATLLPNTSQREFVFGSKGQFSQSCTFVAMRCVLRHLTSSLADFTEEELRFTYGASRDDMEWWCQHIYEYDPDTGLSPWCDGSGLLVNPMEVYMMDEQGKLDSSLFVAIRQLREKYSINELFTNSPLLELFCLIEMDMKSVGRDHVCAYAIVIDGYTFTVGKRGLRYQGLDSHGASSSVLYDGFIDTFAEDMSQAVMRVRPDQPYNELSMGGCYKFAPREITRTVLLEPASEPAETPASPAPAVSVSGCPAGPLGVPSAMSQVDQPSTPFAGVDVVPGSGDTPTPAPPGPETVPGSGRCTGPEGAAEALDTVPGSGRCTGPEGVAEPSKQNKTKLN